MNTTCYNYLISYAHTSRDSVGDEMIGFGEYFISMSAQITSQSVCEKVRESILEDNPQHLSVVIIAINLLDTCEWKDMT